MSREVGERKSTVRMCWGMHESPCVGECTWKLVSVETKKAVYACDLHLAFALRKMGLPAQVHAHEDED